MNSTATGRQGEQLAAEWLVRSGYKILQRNWKTRLCESDFVATRGDDLFFVEVKYRKSDAYGDGFAYLTPKKQQRMRFAAEVWMQAHTYEGNCQLAAISVNGTTSAIDFVEL